MYGIKEGQKVTIIMPDGLAWPAVAVSDAVQTPGKTRDGTDIIIERFDAVSLRETNPANGEVVTYPAFSNEVAQFGYRPNALPRFTTVAGLDADAETGEKLTSQHLMDLVAAAQQAFQKRNFEARNGTTLASDL